MIDPTKPAVETLDVCPLLLYVPRTTVFKGGADENFCFGGMMVDDGYVVIADVTDYDFVAVKLDASGE